MATKNPPQIYGLVGYPITHSLSPAMHTVAFKQLHINGVYLLFETSPGNLAATLKKLRMMRITGFNVTVPFKEEVIAHLDGMDDLAAKIGAVNTVKNEGGRLIGYNTDSLGFFLSLKHDLGFDPRGKKALILGSGGAARAIGFALAQEGVSSLAFFDIVIDKSKKLASDIHAYFPACECVSVMSTGAWCLVTGDLIVNATTCGMKKSDPLPIRVKLLAEGIALYDIIYKPSPTKLVKVARDKGIKAVNGLGMLLYQGARAFEIWTKRKAPVDSMRKALMRVFKRG